MKQKILLVEDQILLLKIIENRLKKEGYEVICCDNGNEAKAYFDKYYFNTVLTDLLMPQACGLELLQYIRNVKHSETPVVVFSEIIVEEKVHEAMNIGANHYICKPFDMNKLIDTIKYYCHE